MYTLKKKKKSKKVKECYKKTISLLLFPVVSWESNEFKAGMAKYWCNKAQDLKHVCFIEVYMPRATLS